MKNNDRKNNDRKINDRKMDENKFRQNSRRELLKLTPVLALGAFAIPSLQEGLLKKGLGFNDWASARLFRSGHLAPTFDNADLTPFTKFPINGYDVDDPGVIFENWTLTVSGAVQKPGDYKLAQVQALPRFRQNTRHICVEGWDVIGRFGGARLSDFLQLVGADPTARFIAVNCADDYYESLDMATARHPQTLLCYEMYEQPLTRQHGAPLRLQIPTKIGYKQAKYLTDLKVSHVLDRVGYWEDQGYSWFYGL
jgi:DMSO/TMAO reductase YedYZ molybdopterin-dependent catalytic subunit